ncbi:MAG: homoserine kinase type II [bacterium]|jgi:homoserine kinase type II
MAVYTKLSDEEILDVLAQFSIASVRYTQGIAKGSENSNYFVETSSGKYVLTIFESRTNEENIPPILDMLSKLGEANIICPNTIAATTGQRRYVLPSGKICILQTFMDGEDILMPSTIQCYAAGKTLANIHNVSATIDNPDINNSLDKPALIALFAELKTAPESEKYDTVNNLISEEFEFQNNILKIDLPSGFIHGDYFKDNVLFTETFVSGVIDFWFASNGSYIYDLAIALNAWGFKNGVFAEDEFNAFLKGYTERRPLTDLERKHLPDKLRLAAVRFLITRLHDKLYGKSSAIMANKPFQTWEKRLQYLQNKQWNF